MREGWFLRDSRDAWGLRRAPCVEFERESLRSCNEFGLDYAGTLLGLNWGYVGINVAPGSNYGTPPQN